jgi:hypothetical protein
LLVISDLELELPITLLQNVEVIKLWFLKDTIMPKPTPYIFILWADHFEEVVATIFVTELRQAGLLVKVVSLNRLPTPGAHGLALVPDMTLDQALPLAAQTTCLVIPSPLRTLQHLKRDPRLSRFFSLAQANQAKFIIGPLSCHPQEELALFALTPEVVTVYPATCEEVVGFAQRLAREMNLISEISDKNAPKSSDNSPRKFKLLP